MCFLNAQINRHHGEQGAPQPMHKFYRFQGYAPFFCSCDVQSHFLICVYLYIKVYANIMCSLAGRLCLFQLPEHKLTSAKNHNRYTKQSTTNKRGPTEEKK